MNEFQTKYDTGATLNAILVAAPTTPIPMTEGTGGIYSANFPTGTAAGIYPYYVANQAGAAWAASDEVVAVGVVVWDGSKEVYLPKGAITSDTLDATAVEAIREATTGTGLYPIDHDGGTGAGDAAVTVNGVDSTTDCMRFTASDGTTGLAGLYLTVYLKADYDTGARAVVAQTTTKSDGRWASPLSLDSGTYYLIADSQGDNYQPAKLTIVVP